MGPTLPPIQRVTEIISMEVEAEGV
jgi:hypothetical protein